MKIKTFLILILILQFNVELYGCNYKLLESHTNSYLAKITAGVSINEDLIRQSVTFLYDGNKLPIEFIPAQNFRDHAESFIRKEYPQTFTNFIETCIRIHSDSALSSLNKIALQILIEKTAEKIQKHFVEVSEFNRVKEELFKKKEAKTAQPVEDISLDVSQVIASDPLLLTPAPAKSIGDLYNKYQVTPQLALQYLFEHFNISRVEVMKLLEAEEELSPSIIIDSNINPEHSLDTREHLEDGAASLRDIV